jgi:hypothetical protein
MLIRNCLLLQASSGDSLTLGWLKGLGHCGAVRSVPGVVGTGTTDFVEAWQRPGACSMVVADAKGT